MAEDHLYFDLRNLAACSIAPLTKADEIGESAQTVTQALVKQLFQLPPTADAVVVKRPAKETIVCPREKPLPATMPKTRWEKFAEEKGIRKQKRSRLVFDDTVQDWVPRHGYKSKKQMEAKQNWCVEVKPGDDPHEDPFEKLRAQKQ